jgi:hypothetical protein
MNTKYLACIVLSGAVLAACTKQSSDSAAAASASAALTDEAVDQAPIPVKEDFEEQARRTITVDNLDDQVSQLEKQIKDDH